MKWWNKLKLKLKGLESGLFTLPPAAKICNIILWQATNTLLNKHTKWIHVTFVMEALVDLSLGSVNLNKPNAKMKENKLFQYGLDQRKWPVCVITPKENEKHNYNVQVELICWNQMVTKTIFSDHVVYSNLD